MERGGNFKFFVDAIFAFTALLRSYKKSAGLWPCASCLLQKKMVYCLKLISITAHPDFALPVVSCASIIQSRVLTNLKSQ